MADEYRFAGLSNENSVAHLFTLEEMVKWANDWEYHPVMLCEARFRPHWAGVMLVGEPLCPECQRRGPSWARAGAYVGRMMARAPNLRQK